MRLTFEGLKERAAWEAAGIRLPSYSVEKAVRAGVQSPRWLHFGSGNIFRMFLLAIADRLLEQGELAGGILAAAPHDYETVDRIYKPHDNLALAVTLRADGSMEKQVLGSLAEIVKADPKDPAAWGRLREIMSDPGLQMVSFTITEKGYALAAADGNFFPEVLADFEKGPSEPSCAMTKVCALLYARYQAGGSPIAMVSMDNCSHNGERLKNSLLTAAGEWERRGFTDPGFSAWLADEDRVSFPWTMIDKITPRPAEAVAEALEEARVEEMELMVTQKKTYAAAFVNGEGPEYLVVEDRFPNGRPALEKAGVYMTDRETVNKTERMKVTACLNPLHTALAVYGCVLGYRLIADEMKDPALSGLVWKLGMDEGLPVVESPGILKPEDFLKEVLTERLPNPFLMDTPQRIATDTSQKVGIRFGETIKAYVRRDGGAKGLTAVPLAIAGWLRYLLAVDDAGQPFELSPDPMAERLHLQLSNASSKELRPLLSNANLFGIDLYQAGLGERIEEMFLELSAGPGAVRRTLEKYVGEYRVKGRK